MSGPILESTQNPFPFQGREFGYQISKTDEAVKKALVRALDLLKKMRWSGAETRIWTAQMEIDTKQKVEKLKYSSPNESGIKGVEKKVREITEWERNILYTIRRYMSESTEMINQLKTLNPPLSSEHLKPFVKAMERDRENTISALNPVASNIDELAFLKNQLREGRFPILSYSPAP